MAQIVPDELIEDVARQFRLLGEPARLRLIQHLRKGELTVGELAELAGATQPNASRHLNAMYEGGLLRRRRDGNSIYYAIAEPVVLQLCDMVCNHTRRQARAKLAAVGR